MGFKLEEAIEVSDQMQCQAGWVEGGEKQGHIKLGICNVNRSTASNIPSGGSSL